MAKKTTAQTKETLLEAYQRVLDEAREQFEIEKAEQQAAWKKELARIKEEDLYLFHKEKRDREDALEIELAARKKDVEERESNVTARENAIGDAEKTISNLQAQVDTIPAVKESASLEGFNKGRAEAEKSFESEIKLINAENDADKKVSENTIKALRESLKSYEGTIDTLKEELSAANARVESIANSAVTAAGQSKVVMQAPQSK